MPNLVTNISKVNVYSETSAIKFLEIFFDHLLNFTFHQILNRIIWTQNKAFKSGLIACLRWDAPETMEHLLYICEHNSAKIWALLDRALTLSLSRHTGEYIPAIVLMPLEIVFNKPHPSLPPATPSEQQHMESCHPPTARSKM
jgi:hypothetical protein